MKIGNNLFGHNDHTGYKDNVMFLYSFPLSHQPEKYFDIVRRLSGNAYSPSTMYQNKLEKFLEILDLFASESTHEQFIDFLSIFSGCTIDFDSDDEYSHKNHAISLYPFLGTVKNKFWAPKSNYAKMLLRDTDVYLVLSTTPLKESARTILTLTRRYGVCQSSVRTIYKKTCEMLDKHE